MLVLPFPNKFTQATLRRLFPFSELLLISSLIIQLREAIEPAVGGIGRCYINVLLLLFFIEYVASLHKIGQLPQALIDQLPRKHHIILGRLLPGPKLRQLLQRPPRLTRIDHLFFLFLREVHSRGYTRYLFHP
jgi:hypothetical protein